MWTQSVTTQSKNSIVDLTNVKSSSTKTTNSKFSSYMNESIQTNVKDTDQVKDKITNDDNSKSLQTKTEEPDANAAKVDANQKEDINSVSKTSSENVTDKKATNDVTNVENETKEEILTKMEAFLETIMTAVASTLEITTDELEEAMEKLGLTTMDLLDMNNLKQVLLNVNGLTDQTAFLTDENLANTLKDLVNVVEEIKSDMPIDPTVIKEHIEQSANKETILQPEQQPISKHSETDVDTTDQEDTTKIEVLKAADNSSETLQKDSSSAKNQDADVDATSQMQTFVNNLAVAGQDDNLDFTQQITKVRQMQDITNQIVEQIKITIKPEQTSMELQLNPDYLGKINLTVASKDGIITAHFVTQNEVAKEAIESQMQVLRDNLNNQGLKVEAIEVTVSNFDFAQSSQTSGDGNKQNNPNKSHRQQSVDDVSITGMEGLPDDVIADELLLEGSSVNYTA